MKQCTVPLLPRRRWACHTRAKPERHRLPDQSHNRYRDVHHRIFLTE